MNNKIDDVLNKNCEQKYWYQCTYHLKGSAIILCNIHLKFLAIFSSIKHTRHILSKKMINFSSSSTFIISNNLSYWSLDWIISSKISWRHVKNFLSQYVVNLLESFIYQKSVRLMSKEWCTIRYVLNQIPIWWIKYRAFAVQ